MNYKNTKKPLLVFTAPLLLLAVIVSLFGYLAVNTITSNKDNVLGSKNNKDKKETNSSENLNKGSNKDLGLTVGVSNANAHNDNVTGVAGSLKNTAKEQSNNPNGEEGTKTMPALTKLADDIQYEILETSSALREIEDRPYWKQLLLGSDYKNLGTLRSSLVHTRNNIRQLEETVLNTQDPEVLATLREQLSILNMEQARITNIIKQGENDTSLLGWMFRWVSGYSNGVSSFESFESTSSALPIEPVQTTESTLPEN